MMRRLSAAVISLAVLATAIVASAEDPPGSSDAQLQKLRAAGGRMRSNFVPEGRTGRYGHAEVLIGAPLEDVRRVVTDYKHYQELAPNKFKTAKVVAKDKQAGTTDLYFQIPILKGMAVLWSRLRFGPPRKDGPVEIIEGKFVEGSVGDMHLVYTLRKVDEKTTVLATDLFIALKFPAPQSLVDEELRDAAADASDMVRSKAEHP